MLVVAQDDLRDLRAETMAEVFTFVGVEPLTDATAFATEEHRSDKKVELSEGAERLRDSPLGGLRHLVPARVRAPLTRRLRQAGGQPLERQPLSPEMRERLKNLLGDEAASLRRLTGLDFATWSV